MDKIINYLESKLPYEIVENIIKLTYQPQPNDLLLDITSFHESKSIIINHYISNEKKTEINNVKEYYIYLISWICNDFILYLNNDLPKLINEKDSDLLNIRDEMVGNLNNTRYLFMLK